MRQKQTLDLSFNNFTRERTYGERFFKKIVGTALDIIGFRAQKVGISVNLVGANNIKLLNKKHRGKNLVTDVLSFPLHSKVDPGSSDYGIIELGDIFICLPFAKKEAKKESNKLENQLRLLTIHGFLHLLGYDHKNPEDGGEMLKLQEKILSKSSF